MDAALKTFLDSGRHLVADTKAPRKVTAKPPKGMKPEEGKDPHKVFVHNAIADKPTKAELLVDIKRFIKQAEDAL